LSPGAVSCRTAALYIHVPYCRAKCGYCAFHSLPISCAQTAEVDMVMDAALRRARSLLERFSVTEFSTAYIGGGTPTALPFSTLRRLLEGTRSMAGERGFSEWTVEANPESLDAQRMSLFADAGVDRISLGVQSTEGSVLRACGRVTTPLDIERALEMLSARWKGRFSVDLIAGLPGQTPDGLRSDIERAAAAGAGHISVYELTVEEGTTIASDLRDGRLQLPSDEEACALWSAAKEACETAGFIRYEVSSWAFPGQECRHNQTYWKVGGSWVGAGPSAVSSFPGDGGRTLRIEEGRDHAAYCVDPGSIAREEEIPPATAAFEAVMTAFRTREGLDTEAFEARFGVPPESLFGKSFARWKDWLVLGQRGPAPSDRLLDILNRFLVDCLDELDHAAPGSLPHRGCLS
jgi:oxygen-independent coproporphyrinogen III oxidase